MKILRIRLANLNSLRGEWLIDFEEEPLAGAGLFLIAGPTGAGKSTLLDAITLALYGRAARYAKDPNPADMMSRFCGECRAEVEFEVASGRYRAEWQLRRARGKPEGAVQPARRFIYDADGQALTQHLRDAEALIEQLVGLDYARFLRSVLLAQGEFARFLRADPDERAGLLESLTGTEIYGQLSILAHEETTRCETALNEKEKDLVRVALLTPEQRDEVTRRITEREAGLVRQRKELEDLNRELAQAGELDRLIKREAGLLVEQAQLGQRARVAEPDLGKLTRHRQAQPYTEDLSRLAAADELARDQENRAGLGVLAGRRARQEWVATLAAAGDFAGTQARQAGEAVGRAETQVAAAEQQAQEAAVWLTAHAAERSLGGALPEIAGQLKSLESLRQDLSQSRSRLAALARATRQQAENIASAEKASAGALAMLHQREADKAAARQALELVLAGLTVEAREQEASQLRTQVDALGQLILLEEAARQKQSALADQQRRVAELKLSLERSLTTLTAAGDRKGAAEQALALRLDHLQKAKLIASLEEHRAGLRPGEACPLCGATEHPLAEKSRPAISETELETEVRQVREASTVAEAAWLKANRAATRASADHTNATETLAKDTAELDALRQRATGLATAQGLAAASLEELSALKMQWSARVEALVQECNRIREAAGKHDAVERARVQAENQSRLAQQAGKAAQGLLAQSQVQIEEQTKAATGLEERLETTVTSLAGLLQPYQVAVPDPSREQAGLADLTRRRDVFQAREEALRQVTTALETARHGRENTRQSLAALTQRTAPLIAEAQSLAGGPDYPDAKARALLAKSWTTLDQAEQRVRGCAAALAIAEKTATQRQEESARARAAWQKTVEALEARVAGSEFATLAGLRAARLAPEALTRLEGLEQQLRREAEALDGRLSETRQRLGELRAAGTAEGDAVAELARRQPARQQETEALAAGILQDKDALGRDQAERERQAALAGTLERERVRVRVWQQLRGLIGSHDGRKFRRYAQGLSLDVLIDHANRHLARLTDRYRMRRRGGEELELEIEDLYQAGVTRPMASLSGGESFLASLALALGLAALAGRNVRIDSLFIDEGFGSLDADTLDTAISALETLRQDAKTVGIVSHVDLLKERITTQILVEKLAAGASGLRLVS